MYNNELRGLDSWLERPYQDMMEAGDAFVEWAEMEGYDLDDPEAEKAYEDYLEGSAEDEAEAKYEAYLDRIEMEAEEREYEDWNY